MVKGQITYGESLPKKNPQRDRQQRPRRSSTLGIATDTLRNSVACGVRLQLVNETFGISFYMCWLLTVLSQIKCHSLIILATVIVLYMWVEGVNGCLKPYMLNIYQFISLPLNYTTMIRSINVKSKTEKYKAGQLSLFLKI